MIQHQVAQYLLTTYHDEECRHENRVDYQRVAVLVETRDCYFLPWVIKNFCRELGSGWNFHLFINEKVRAFLTEVLPHFHYQWTPVHAQRMTTTQYSSLLRQQFFWEQIRENIILVFQVDCLLLKPIPSWAENYDMIGAPCGLLHEDQFILNGGFSLRNKQAMMEVSLTTEENAREQRPEDVFFTQELRKRQQFKLPTMRISYQFATEDVHSTHPVGIHGTDKYYGS